ncbi:MAG: hypothetical protein JJE35_00405 [Thermoleophilia bacterium]|nr:hypothetical protein [Thermoleophilia bacterium]
MSGRIKSAVGARSDTALVQFGDDLGPPPVRRAGLDPILLRESVDGCLGSVKQKRYRDSEMPLLDLLAREVQMIAGKNLFCLRGHCPECRAQFGAKPQKPSKTWMS